MRNAAGRLVPETDEVLRQDDRVGAGMPRPTKAAIHRRPKADLGHASAESSD